jgi:hypothetical protein
MTTTTKTPIYIPLNDIESAEKLPAVVVEVYYDENETDMEKRLKAKIYSSQDDNIKLIQEKLKSPPPKPPKVTGGKSKKSRKSRKARKSLRRK